MSESFDVEQFQTLMTHLRNVITRHKAMAEAIAGFGSGVDLAPGADYSGLDTAITALVSSAKQAVAQYNALVDVAKDVAKADKSWGDYIKGFHVKTGWKTLDDYVELETSVGAGVVDGAHDLGLGVYSMGKGIVYAPYDTATHKEGDPWPWQKPGLALINIAVHPLNTGKAFVGWQYRDDPGRMMGYGGFNVLTTIFTGGAGEVAEAGMGARLARLTERGGIAEGEAVAEVERMQARLKAPLNRPAGITDRVKWTKRKRAWQRGDLARAQERLAELQKANAAAQARWQGMIDRLTAARGTRPMRLATIVQSLGVPVTIRHFLPENPVAEIIASTLEHAMELGMIGDAGTEYPEHEVRRRLREIAASRPAAGA